MEVQQKACLVEDTFGFRVLPFFHLWKHQHFESVCLRAACSSRCRFKDLVTGKIDSALVCAGSQTRSCSLVQFQGPPGDCLTAGTLRSWLLNPAGIDQRATRSCNQQCCHAMTTDVGFTSTSFLHTGISYADTSYL